MKKLLMVLALLGVLGVLALPVPAADSGDSGAALFAANCATCHGPQGKGDGPAGAALDPRPADLTKKPYKHGCCAPMIGKTLSSGVHGTAMPSFAATLTDAQRSALASYVVSLQTGGCGGGGCKQKSEPCPKKSDSCCKKG